MGLLLRKDFSGGWQPDADAVNGPVNALLRQDNLTLDEHGVLSRRLGSEKVNSAAFADLDVHSLFTAYNAGTRYRYAGATNKVYRNGTALSPTMAGTATDEVAFGSYLGQAFFARSTSKWKDDGTTTQRWGLAAPTVLPTVVAIAPNTVDLATANGTGHASVENLWAGAEGTLTSAGIAGFDGTANGAQQMLADATTFRATVTRTTPAITAASNANPIEITAAGHSVQTGQRVTIAGVTGNTAANGTHIATRVSNDIFSIPVAGNGAYAGGGTFTLDLTYFASGVSGTDEDVVGFYVNVDDPLKLDSLTMMLDFNDGSFETDVARFTWTNLVEEITEVQVEEPLESRYDVEGFSREEVRYRTERRSSFVASFRPDAAGWTFLSAKRGQFAITHTTDLKWWNTVRAVRFTFSGPAASTLQFDRIRISGGSTKQLEGQYRFRYIYAREGTYYTGLSGSSPESADIVLQNEGATVTITRPPVVSPVDQQVTHVWVYMMGGTLPGFYRVARAAITVWDGTTQAVTVTGGDVDALIADLPLAISNTVPPDNIISIAGPHYDRIFCLTSSGTLHPSRRLNPDSFSTGQEIRVTGPDETPFWVLKNDAGLYCGTSRDIYRIDGTGAEFPDGTMDFTLTALGIGNPPFNKGVALQDTSLVYFSGDGWRALGGGGSVALAGKTSLLYKGQVRHEIGPINVATGRFRAAFTKSELHCLTPEGTDASSTAKIYRLGGGRWERRTYPNNFRSILCEPDGTLLAGDNAGFVWKLETGTQDDGANPQYDIWWRHDDNGEPLNRKKPQFLHVRSDTGGVNTGLAIYLDGSAGQAINVNPNASGESVDTFDLDALVETVQFGVRMTGSTQTFRLYEWAIQYEALPQQFRGQVPYTNAGYLCEKVISGLQFRVNTLGVARVFTPLFDGTAQTTFTLTTNATERPEFYTHQLDAPTTVKEVAWTVDGMVELYGWEPHVLYRNPCPRRVWDTGHVELGKDEQVWLTRIFVKAKTPYNLLVTPYMDDTAAASVDVTVGPNQQNRVTVHEARLGREVRGACARAIVSAQPPHEAQFYWVEFWFRGSGGETQKKRVTFEAK